MIESCYWKEELQRIAKAITPVSKPGRWSERSHAIVEREIIIGFFVLRRLIEINEVSSVTRSHQMTVYASPRKAKCVTRRNAHRIDECYDFAKEKTISKTPLYLSNQFIHAYTGLVARDETRNWSDVLIVSDYDRNDCIWRVPLAAIRILFLLASRDYPHTVIQTYDNTKKDYVVKTN